MPTVNLWMRQDMVDASARRERTCVPSDHVEQIVRHGCLECPLDFGEFRNAAVVHELKDAVRYATSADASNAAYHKFAVRPWMAVVQAECTCSGRADMGTAQRFSS